MNDEHRPPEDTDPGEPLAELAELRDPPSPEFGQRIRNSISRRISVGDTIDFSLMALFSAFLNYLEMAFEAWGKPTNHKKDQN